jgi:asparagine synthetase B (glutamine-hydrolysing)
MNISKWFRRRKLTDEELREEEESRLRAAEEARLAEQDSERSRQQSKVPSGPFSGGGVGGGF